MRCATVTTIYAFTGTGTTRGSYTGLTVGAELAAGESCAVGQYTVASAAEWSAVSSYSSFTDLSPSQAGEVATAILLVWACAWAFRMAIRAVNNAFNSPSEND